MKKILALFLIAGSAVFVSCTKSGALTGSGTSGTSSFGTISGSANGGLSPISGASVNLYLGGNSTPVASATTAADGSFSIVFNGQASGNFLYLTITGGNAGSGTNSNNQLMSIVGTSGVPLSSLKVNEMSTAATELAAFNMGLLTDNNGTIALSAPKNASSAGNVVTQFNNIIANGNLNTSNSSLTTSAQNGLLVMANDFASCIESSANCSKLFNSAQSTAGAAASTVFESGYNALLNSSATSSFLYKIAAPLGSTTGYTLPSPTMPGGFTFNNPLPVSTNTFAAVANAIGVAVDASGNIWVSSRTAPTVVKLSPTGATLGSFTIGTGPYAIVIDAANNIWISNAGTNTVSELNSAGTTLGTFTVGSGPAGMAIDASGNIWVANSGSGSVSELNASGTVIATFSGFNAPEGVTVDTSGNPWIYDFNAGKAYKYNAQGTPITSFSTGFHPVNLAFDASGNAWIVNQDANTVEETNSGGAVLQTINTIGITPRGLAFDAKGNLWVTLQGGGSNQGLEEINPSVGIIANYPLASAPVGIAIDSSGNIWLANRFTTTVTEVLGATMAPQFFPYSGPVFPSESF